MDENLQKITDFNQIPVLKPTTLYVSPFQQFMKLETVIPDSTKGTIIMDSRNHTSDLQTPDAESFVFHRGQNIFSDMRNDISSAQKHRAEFALPT